MKRIYFACLFQFLTTTFLLSQSSPVSLVNQTARVVPPISASQSDPKAQAKILDSYGKLPLSFEANRGQADARVKFLSRTSGYSLFLTGDEAVLTLSGKKADPHKTNAAHTLPSDMAQTKAGGVLRMKLRNANAAAKVTGTDELAGTSNYFIGNDPAKWRSNVPTYAKVKYEGIYSGIDLVFEFKGQTAVTVLVSVGTFKRGPSGVPALISVSITDMNGISRPVRHLSDLPVELHRPAPRLPRDLPVPVGALLSVPKSRGIDPPLRNC